MAEAKLDKVERKVVTEEIVVVLTLTREEAQALRNVTGMTGVLVLQKCGLGDVYKALQPFTATGDGPYFIEGPTK